MVEEIHELKKIIYLIHEYYETLIDEELETFSNPLRHQLFKDKLKDLIERENKVLNNILSKYGLDKVTSYINNLKEKASKFDDVVLTRILNKINSIRPSESFIDRLKTSVEKETYLLSLAILTQIIEEHPELKDKLILSIYYSYFDVENIELEEEIIANNFEINKHPMISSDILSSIYMPNDVHNIFKDSILFEIFKEKIQILVVLALYTNDYDLIYYNVSFIRAIIIEATNKENFTNALRSILEDETYQEAHVFIKEILNKLDVDQSIPIYISNRPKRG
ncbi:MAG TPA: hypothetical protein IAB65_02610 [Candidatus Onthocola stercorigallinarum]|nr:hypothetical protein [Candidatus Onthocola stercorigallinarum]